MVLVLGMRAIEYKESHSLSQDTTAQLLVYFAADFCSSESLIYAVKYLHKGQQELWMKY